MTDYATQKHDERYDTLIAKALKEDRSKGLGFNPITWKRRKIGGKLLLITNRKSHTGFPGTDLDDLEWCNSHNFAYFTEFDCFAGQLRQSG